MPIIKFKRKDGEIYICQKCKIELSYKYLDRHAKNKHNGTSILIKMK